MYKKIFVTISLIIIALFLISSTLEKESFNTKFVKSDYSSFDNFNITITSNEELNNFLDKYKEISTKFLEEIEIYNDKYFETNNLVICYFIETSSSITHEVSNIDFKKNILNIEITQDSPDRITQDMIGWLLVVETSNDYDIEDVDLTFIRK